MIHLHAQQVTCTHSATHELQCTLHATVFVHVSVSVRIVYTQTKACPQTLALHTCTGHSFTPPPPPPKKNIFSKYYQVATALLVAGPTLVAGPSSPVQWLVPINTQFKVCQYNSSFQL